METMETSDNIQETIKLNKLVERYLNSLSDQERKTMEIAKSHLGTSFNIKKSVGFLKWKSSNQ